MGQLSESRLLSESSLFMLRRLSSSRLSSPLRHEIDVFDREGRRRNGKTVPAKSFGMWKAITSGICCPTSSGVSPSATQTRPVRNTGRMVAFSPLDQNGTANGAGQPADGDLRKARRDSPATAAARRQPPGARPELASASARACKRACATSSRSKGHGTHRVVRWLASNHVLMGHPLPPPCAHAWPAGRRTLDHQHSATSAATACALPRSCCTAASRRPPSQTRNGPSASTARSPTAARSSSGADGRKPVSSVLDKITARRRVCQRLSAAMRSNRASASGTQ